MNERPHHVSSWLLGIASALAALSAIAAPAFGAERVDLFDTKGNRTGYAIVDWAMGRVDFYDKDSRRTGYGKVNERGQIGRFDLKGRREGTTVVPLAPKPTAR